MDIIVEKNLHLNTGRKKKVGIMSIFGKKSRSISEEDREIVMALSDLSKEMKSLHLNFDNITDPDLIDAHIYEIKAVNMRYKYYLEMCKEKGIIANVF